MTKRTRYSILTLAALCCMIWAACTQERQACLTPKIASLNIECMHKITDTATVFVDTALPTALLVAFTDSGAQAYIYRNQNADFTLSLSPIADSCKWGITTDTFGTSIDTLTFVYQRNLQFISNACGYAYFYNLKSVRTTHIRIDSVLITNTNVTNNVNTKHLQVYIHPDY